MKVHAESSEYVNVHCPRCGRIVEVEVNVRLVFVPYSPNIGGGRDVIETESPYELHACEVSHAG